MNTSDNTSRSRETIEMARLRDLLVGNESRAIVELHDRIDQVSNLEHLSQNLPAALQQTHHLPKSELAQSLQLPLVEALQLSAQHNKKSLSEALFPILGPAIRYYVKETFQGMFDQLNETLRSATSLSRIKWWLEAKLTGKDVSEYIMLKTLDYEVQNLLLVSPDSGLLLQHVTRDELLSEDDPDLISNMLVAIRSFVKDSFSDGQESQEELGRFSFGEKEILLENGPRAILAAVTTGMPPASYREEMRRALEQLHVKAAKPLANFSGDTMELCHECDEYLSPLLDRVESQPEKGSAWPGYICVIGILAVLISLIGLSLRDRHYQSKLKTAISKEPGVELISIGKRAFGRGEIKLLRDLKAKSVDHVLTAAGIPVDWRRINEVAFESMDVEFVSQRNAERIQNEKQLIVGFNQQISSVQSSSDTCYNDLLLYVDLQNTEQDTLTTNAISAIKLEHQSQLEQLTKRLEKTQDLAATLMPKADYLRYLESDFFRRYPIEDRAQLIHLADSQWQLQGQVSEPYFSQIQSQKDRLIAGHQVSLDEVELLVDPRREELRKLIEITTIRFHNGTDWLHRSGRDSLDQLATAIDDYYKTFPNNKPVVPSVTVHATKLQGRDSAPNVAIVKRRIDLVTKRLKETLPELKSVDVIESLSGPRERGVYITISR